MEDGEKLANIVKEHDFEIVSITKKKGNEFAPKLFDLTGLQVYCNTKFVYEPALQPEYTNPPNCFAGHITDINELMDEGYNKDNDA